MKSEKRKAKRISKAKTRLADRGSSKSKIIRAKAKMKKLKKHYDEYLKTEKNLNDAEAMFNAGENVCITQTCRRGCCSCGRRFAA